ncbi:protein RESPONSE TO ABA AND SALT 1-like [Cornus florida]|uniref:protein RESPONSE TO ABA AND SALT 1-like n=1 Tax=Cornus florida TaxID=4283 RepID=UPI0028A06258|nr:protein RESPONSE TO ABA AND SALT 1-like [Cornus florida]
MPGRSTAETSCSNNDGPFVTFLEVWLVRQQHLLDELVTAQQNLHESRNDYFRDLTTRVSSHYQQYYHEKFREVSRNTFGVLSPPWFTPYERTLLWISGFKPDLAFRLVERSVGGELSQDQSQRMNQLVEETEREKIDLENQLEEVQMSVAALPMVQAMRGRRRGRDGVGEELGTVVERLRERMEGVVVRADWLRMTTVEGVMGILSPVQNVKFLAAATQLQLNIRRWGLQKEAETESRQAPNE